MNIISKLVAAWHAQIAPIAGRCGNCARFRNDARVIEALFPGLTAMGSGFASVRAGDGICMLRDVYLSEHASCDRFEERILSGVDAKAE